MAIGVAPGVKMVADDDTVETELLRENSIAEQIGRRELLRRRLPAECQHGSDIL